jgi:hypothetical protein
MFRVQTMLCCSSEQVLGFKQNNRLPPIRGHLQRYQQDRQTRNIRDVLYVFIFVDSTSVSQTLLTTCLPFFPAKLTFARVSPASRPFGHRLGSYPNGGTSIPFASRYSRMRCHPTPPSSSFTLCCDKCKNVKDVPLFGRSQVTNSILDELPVFENPDFRLIVQKCFQTCGIQVCSKITEHP